MSVALDVSHSEMSPLNDAAPMNAVLMSVTLDTSHSPIGPCEAFEELYLRDFFLRHAFTARTSSSLDRGENAGSVVTAVTLFGDREFRFALLKDVLTARVRFKLDGGELAASIVVACIPPSFESDKDVHTVSFIDRGKAANISSLLAFE